MRLLAFGLLLMMAACGVQRAVAGPAPAPHYASTPMQAETGHADAISSTKAALKPIANATAAKHTKTSAPSKWRTAKQLLRSLHAARQSAPVPPTKTGKQLNKKILLIVGGGVLLLVLLIAFLPGYVFVPLLLLIVLLGFAPWLVTADW